METQVRKISFIADDIDAEWLEQQPGKNISEKLRAVLRNARKKGLPDFVEEQLQPLPDTETTEYATKKEVQDLDDILSAQIVALNNKLAMFQGRIIALEEKK